MTLLDVRQQVIERAELLEERRGESLADPGDAGDVVDRVPRQGQEVHDLVGADAPVLLEGRGVDDGVLAQVEDPDVVGEELAGVLVGRADDDVEPALLAAPGQGGDDVVGLHSRLDQDGNLEPFEDPADQRNLGDQVGGHLGPVGLVLGVDVRAEDRPGPVEGGGEVIGLAVPEQVEHVAEDSEDRLRGLARGPGHLGDRVEDLEDQGEGIQDVEGGSLRHRACESPRLGVSRGSGCDRESYHPAAIAASTSQ